MLRLNHKYTIIINHQLLILNKYDILNDDKEKIKNVVRITL